jgi:hypothetical protein
MPKGRLNLNLSPEVVAQIADLKGYYGDTPSEIVAFILRNWFHQNRVAIGETKAEIDALRTRAPEAFAEDGESS